MDRGVRFTSLGRNRLSLRSWLTEASMLATFRRRLIPRNASRMIEFCAKLTVAASWTLGHMTRWFWRRKCSRLGGRLGLRWGAFFVICAVSANGLRGFYMPILVFKLLDLCHLLPLHHKILSLLPREPLTESVYVVLASLRLPWP